MAYGRDYGEVTNGDFGKFGRPSPEEMRERHERHHGEEDEGERGEREGGTGEKVREMAFEMESAKHPWLDEKSIRRIVEDELKFDEKGDYKRQAAAWAREHGNGGEEPGGVAIIVKD